MGAVLFAAVAAVSYGSNDFLASYFGRRQSPQLIAVLCQLFSGWLLLVVSLWLPTHMVSADWLWVFLAGVSNGFGTLSLFRGLSVGRISTVAPLSGVVASAIPAGLGLLLDGGGPVLMVLGVLLGICSIPLMTGTDVRGRRSEISAAIHGILGGVGFAGSWLSLSNFSRASGPLPIALELLLSSGVVAALWACLGFSFERPTYSETIRIALFMGPLGAIASLFFVLAAHAGNVAIAAVVAALYPGVTVLLGRFIYREVLGSLQALGLVTALSSIGLIAASR